MSFWLGVTASSRVQTTVPGAPTSVSATGGNQQAALTWTAPDSTGGSPITGYRIESNPGSGWSVAVSNTGSTSTSYTVTGLTNGTAYTFRVSAINSIGTGPASSASNSVTPSFPTTYDLAASVSGSPYVAAYPWNSNGLGPKYSDPATLPSGSGGAYDVRFFGATYGALGVARESLSGITVYRWNRGFGTPYTSVTGAQTLSPANTQGYVVVYNPQGTSAYYLDAYPWSASGFGTKYGNSPVNFNPSRMSFNSAATALSWGGGGSYVGAFNFSSSGWGAQWADPNPYPPQLLYDIHFNPTGSAGLAMAHAGAPYVSVYRGTSGSYGTKYANPASALPGDRALGVKFSNSGNLLFVGTLGSPFIHAYNWSNGFGSKYADPSSLPPDDATKIDVTPDTTAVAVSLNVSPYINLYPWSSGFGTKYANPATLPTTAVTGVEFSPN